jgi:hypothetical protein
MNEQMMKSFRVSVLTAIRAESILHNISAI